MTNNNERVLDWRKSPPDPRDRLMTPKLQEAPAITADVTRLWAGPYIKVDQRREGACVGFSITNDLMGSPVRVRPPGYDKATGANKTEVANKFGQNLFVIARRNFDEWPGEDYDGTSVRAGWKAAKSLGYVGEYRRVTTPADFRATLRTYGPLEVGINWYSNQFDYDPTTFTVKAGGDLAGGHALCINGIYVRRFGRKQYRARQSWGEGYGDGGDVWFDADHLEHLVFEDNGEAWVGLDRSYGPTQP